MTNKENPAEAAPAGMGAEPAKMTPIEQAESAQRSKQGRRAVNSRRDHAEPTPAPEQPTTAKSRIRDVTDSNIGLSFQFLNVTKPK